MFLHKDAPSAKLVFRHGEDQLHQAADGSLRLRVRSDTLDETRVRTALLRLFGTSQRLTIETRPVFDGGDKVVQYSSELVAEH